MKFSEKLQKLRKDLKLSQEDLANALDVSRQAVSKWESGQTYPEMDKLIAMSKMFKCSLDSLTNDEVAEIDVIKNKENGITLINDLLNIINKTISMFKEMSAKQIAKCIVIMFIVFMGLMLLQVPVEMIYSLGDNIFSNFGPAYSILSSIWYFILQCSYITLFVILFVYIYKVLYLDNFEAREKDKPARLKSKGSPEEVNEEEVSITEKKNTSNVQTKQRGISKIFSVLGAIFSWFIKVIVVITGIPFTFSLLMLSITLVLWFALAFKGVTILGILIIVLSTIALNILILELMYSFLVNKKIAIKRTLITFVTSIILLGSGIGLTLIYASKLSYIESVPEHLKKETKTATYAMDNNLIIMEYYDGVKYHEDANLGKNIEIKVTYYSEIYDISIINYSSNKIEIHQSSMFEKYPSKLINYLINDLKNKKIVNYDMARIVVDVYGTKENIDKIKANADEYFSNEKLIQDTINDYENRMSDLYDEIYELEQKVNNFEYEKIELIQKYEDEILNLKEEIQSYKDKISELFVD